MHHDTQRRARAAFTPLLCCNEETEQPSLLCFVIRIRHRRAPPDPRTHRRANTRHRSTRRSAQHCYPARQWAVNTWHNLERSAGSTSSLATCDQVQLATGDWLAVFLAATLGAVQAQRSGTQEERYTQRTRLCAA